MNYYPFNIGDYRKDTQGLQPIEHYIYRTLLDECYLTELPLNPDIRELIRDLRLTSDQKDDLLYVLGKFFELTEDGYINHRVNATLSKTYNKSEKARASVKARWDKYNRKKKTNERNTNVEQTNNDSNTDGILPNTQYPIPNTDGSKATTKGSAKKRSNGRFKPPTPDQVQAYIDEKQYQGFTGEIFCDFYIARNWQLSHGKQMADWKAAVRTWNNRRKGDDNSAPYAQGAI